MIQTTTWSDDRVSELPRDAKLVWVYLLTNIHTNACGCYKLPRRNSAFELGMTTDELEQCLDTLEASGMVVLDKKTGEVLLPNWLQHNTNGSPKYAQAVGSAIDRVESDTLRYRIDTLSKGMHTLSKHIDTLSKRIATDTDTDTETDTETETERMKNARSRFTPPTTTECLDYAREIGLPDSEAEAFHDHFTSNGWKVGGKTTMKDWRSAMRNWKRRAKLPDVPEPAAVLEYFTGKMPSADAAEVDGAARRFYVHYQARGWKTATGVTITDWKAKAIEWIRGNP